MLQSLQEVLVRSSYGPLGVRILSSYGVGRVGVKAALRTFRVSDFSSDMPGEARGSGFRVFNSHTRKAGMAGTVRV